MKKHHFIFPFFFSFWATQPFFAQSIFAPKMGAEWHYYFISDNYEEKEYEGRPTNKREGILEVRYSKDTLVKGITMKKWNKGKSINTKAKIRFTLSFLPLF